MTGQLWAQGDVYQRFMGRWSNLVADEFVAWVGVDAGARWLDVGCGAGALGSRILAGARPEKLVGVDASAPFLEEARRRLGDDAEFHVGDAADLPFEDDTFDVAVSGLVLNFLPDPAAAVREHARVSRGTVAAYVWDYTDGMEMLRFFWEEARALDPEAAALDESARFRLVGENGLRGAFTEAGLERLESRAIDIPMVFADFDDYWTPFLGGQGPAGSYAVGLDDGRREAFRERLRERLPVADDGSVELKGRAWAVKASSAA